MSALRISTDPAELDLSLVHRFPSTRPTGAAASGGDGGRASRPILLCFGAYPDGVGQVGFARVVTDQATFGYLADVFVLPEHRGRATRSNSSRR